MKKFRWCLVALFLVGCHPNIDRQMNITIVNESGIVIKKALLRIHIAEYPAYKGDSIVVSNIQIGKAFDLRYNLEHTEAFSEPSRRIEITFDNPQRTYLQKEVGTFDFRKTFNNFKVIIKPDTIIRQDLRQ